MRVLFSGGRRFKDRDLVAGVLEQLPPGSVLVQGGALGADQLVMHTGKKMGLKVETHRADWKNCTSDCPPGHRRDNARGSYCPMAGLRRNSLMADLGADLCIVFPGGKGTNDMAAKARARGIRVIEAFQVRSNGLPTLTSTRSRPSPT